MASAASAVVLCACVVFCSGFGYDWSPRWGQGRLNDYHPLSDPHYEPPFYGRRHLDLTYPNQGSVSVLHNIGYQPTQHRRYRRSVASYADPSAVHGGHHDHVDSRFPFDRFDNRRFRSDRFDNRRFRSDRFDNRRFRSDRFDNRRFRSDRFDNRRWRGRSPFGDRDFDGPFGRGGRRNGLFRNRFNRFQNRFRGNRLD